MSNREEVQTRTDKTVTERGDGKLNSTVDETLGDKKRVRNRSDDTCRRTVLRKHAPERLKRKRKRNKQAAARKRRKKNKIQLAEITKKYGDLKVIFGDNEESSHATGQIGSGSGRQKRRQRQRAKRALLAWYRKTKAESNTHSDQENENGMKQIKQQHPKEETSEMRDTGTWETVTARQAKRESLKITLVRTKNGDYKIIQNRDSSMESRPSSSCNFKAGLSDENDPVLHEQEEENQTVKGTENMEWSREPKDRAEINKEPESETDVVLTETEEKQRRRQDWLQREIQIQKVISAARREKMLQTTPLQRRLMALREELEKKKVDRTVRPYFSTYVPEVVKRAEEEARRKREKAITAKTETRQCIDRYPSSELGWNLRRWGELFK